jgi:hypothetical protein
MQTRPATNRSPFLTGFSIKGFSQPGATCRWCDGDLEDPKSAGSRLAVGDLKDRLLEWVDAHCPTP